MKKNTVVFLLLGLITLLGLIYRLYGISINHSFWSDEAQISIMAKNIVTGDISLLDAVRIQDYQALHVVFTAVAFALFGFSEFSARIFPVIFGTIGIIFAFLLARRLSNAYAGLLAAFLYAFSHLNLSHSTQAKQYAAIETLVLVVFYLLARLKQEKKHTVYLHLGIISACATTTLLHFLGVLLWIPYMSFLIYEYKEAIVKILKNPKQMAIFIGISIVLFFLFRVPLMIQTFVGSSLKETFMPYNHIIYFIKVVCIGYGLFLVPAGLAVLFSWKKNPAITLGVILWTTALFYLWTFKHYTHNVRYIVPFFGLLFVYFSLAVNLLAEKLPIKHTYILPLTVAVILFVTGYKIVRLPATYYNPNVELFADVQNANYKEAYSQLKQKYPDIDSYVIYNDVVEPQQWYLDGRSPDGLFVKDYTFALKYGETTKYGLTDITIFTTLAQFQTEMKKNPRGVIVVEDWESILSEEIKQYAKKNLKREIRVEGLPEAKGDNWPIEIYSWGL